MCHSCVLFKNSSILFNVPKGLVSRKPFTSVLHGGFFVNLHHFVLFASRMRSQRGDCSRSATANFTRTDLVGWFGRGSTEHQKDVLLFSRAGRNPVLPFGAPLVLTNEPDRSQGQFFPKTSIQCLRHWTPQCNYVQLIYLPTQTRSPSAGAGRP